MLRGEKNRQKGPFFFKWELYLHNLYFKQLLSWNWTSTDHKAWSVYCKCRISQRWTCASEAVPLFNKLKRNIERCIKEKIHTYEVLAVVSTFGHLSDPFSSPQELILVIINLFFLFFFFLWSFALNAVLVVLIFFYSFEWFCFFFFKVSKWWYI